MSDNKKYKYRPGAPIKIEDIRVGDLVRWIRVNEGCTEILEGVADNEYSGSTSFVCISGCCLMANGSHISYELIERPQPKLAPNQVWRHEPSGTIFTTIKTRLGVLSFVDCCGVELALSVWNEYKEDVIYLGEVEIGVKK